MERLESNNSNQKEIILKITSQLTKIQNKFREKWSTFNTKYCIMGLISFFLSILSLFVESSIIGERKNLKLLKDSFLIFIFVLTLTFIFSFNLTLNISLYLFMFNLKFLIGNTNLTKIFGFFRNRFLNIYEYSIFTFTCLIPFSNSFIINENVNLRFFLVSLFVLEALSKKSLKPVFLASLLRMTWVFYVCREEVAAFCNQTMFSIQLEKILSFSYLSYTTYIFFNFSLIFLIYFYLAKKNLKLFFLKENILNMLNLILLFTYNLIQLQIYNRSLVNQDDSEALKVANLYLARIIHILAFLVVYLSNSSKKNHRLFDSMISIAIFTSLLSSQSLLSIWILIFILFEFFVQKSSPVIIKGI